MASRSRCSDVARTAAERDSRAVLQPVADVRLGGRRDQRRRGHHRQRDLLHRQRFCSVQRGADPSRGHAGEQRPGDRATTLRRDRDRCRDQQQRSGGRQQAALGKSQRDRVRPLVQGCQHDTAASVRGQLLVERAQRLGRRGRHRQQLAGLLRQRGRRKAPDPGRRASQRLRQRRQCRRRRRRLLVRQRYVDRDAVAGRGGARDRDAADADRPADAAAGGVADTRRRTRDQQERNDPRLQRQRLPDPHARRAADLRPAHRSPGAGDRRDPGRGQGHRQRRERRQDR